MAQPAPPRVPLRTLVAQQIGVYNQAHPKAIDPRAALAVAAQEGLGGGVGDQGTSYGPWQLHKGGAYPLSAPQDPQQAQQWASSPAGIDYALNQIGSVAGGLTGSKAVQAIVSRFERPANPGREIAGALNAYGGQPLSGLAQQPGAQSASLAAAAGGTAAAQASAPAQPTPDFRAELARQLATATGSPTNDLTGFYQTLHQALQARQQAAQTASTAAPVKMPATNKSPQIAPGATGIAKTALTQLGTPYQWGGKAQLGSRTDCSGLLQASARANGIQLARTTYQQYKQGTPVPLNQLQPGDAVFSEPTAQGPGHVSIYIGNGKVVEDPHTGASVQISTLAGRRGIVGARRYG